jgi:uridylate kinase
MRVVLKIGGSVSELDNLRTLAGYIKSWKEKHEIAVVVGGGKISRELDELGRKVTAKEHLLDLLGIYAARVNATLLIAALEEDACPEIPKSEVEFQALLKKYPEKTIIAGGFKPGQRTDAVAVQIALDWNADLVVKCTNVDYVYDKDPNEFSDAKAIEKMSFEELQKLADPKHSANKPTIMDKVAAEILVKNRIKLAVVNGKDWDNVEKVLSNQEFKGTRVGF